MSTTAGLQVPVIPFNDGLVNVGTVPPAQIVSVVPKLNVGVIFGFTVTVKLNGNAHCPAVGVKVYVPELVLLTTDGLHVPLIPLSDGEYNVGTEPPEQMVMFPKLNVGITLGITVTLNVAGTAH